MPSMQSFIMLLKEPGPVIRRVISERKPPEQYVELVMRDSGWSRKEAVRAMKKARRLGITFKYYATRHLCLCSEEELPHMAARARAYTDRENTARKEALDVIARATGWPEDRVLLEVNKAREAYGSTTKDYAHFRFWEKTPEEQATYLTTGVMDQLYLKYNADDEGVKTLIRKNRFAKRFSDLYGRVWFLNRSISYKTFLKKCQGLDALILKPSAATQGKGVEKVELPWGDETAMRALYDELMDRRLYLCEEPIIQHPAMAAFNPSSVNTVRVMTIVKDDVCHFVYAGFRMGRGALVDNFHAGGVIATVDVETGVTVMDAIDLEGNHYPLHPGSGLPTKGFQIPNWPKVRALVEKAALRMAGVGEDPDNPQPKAAMVGWDVAITQDGVCLVEGNSEPSHTIIQLPYVDAGIGMRHVVEPYL